MTKQSLFDILKSIFNPMSEKKSVKFAKDEISINPIVEHELAILKFWQENKIFEKTLAATKNGPPYSFYDGPPFATGAPHYGHIITGLMKDVVPRYQTMKGNYVERRWGWDCHGLPIENIVEKDLGLKSKKDIEEMGIDKFNEMCRARVLDYVEDWQRTIDRFGRWVDMENSYKTMDLDYMESVWWVFKQLWDKGLIYEGYKSMHVCPRCETTLSQQEVSEGYKDIKDWSVTVELELEDEPRTFVLAWTTTPWTLPGNVALAVGEDIEYVKIEKKDEGVGELVRFILAKDLLEKIFSENEYKIISEFKGSALVGKKYKPLFPYYLNEDLKNKENLYTVVSADFVTTEDGTGVVHIAPAYGEEDMLLGQEKNLPFIQNVTMSGHFKDEVEDFKGMNVKPADDPQKTDVEIIKYLDKNNLLFGKEKYEHSYPHCWRCDTPLINYATSSWFVKVTAIKEKAIKLAKEINWSPAHIKEGRFGNWLEGARDWSISRQRFWASCIPIWKCECGEIKVIGSLDELYKNSDGITKIILVRHGEAESNIRNVNSGMASRLKYSLTAKGKKQIIETIKKIKAELDKSDNIVMFSSPIKRTKETAELIANNLKIEFQTDDRLGEIEVGYWEDKEREALKNDLLNIEYHNLSLEERFKFKKGGFGENNLDVIKRMHGFLSEKLKEHGGKTILIISHGDPIVDLTSKLKNKNIHDSAMALESVDYIEGGGVRVIYINNTTNIEIDLHKDVMDIITLKCEKCGGTMKRIPDVVDCWFESGSMPYAQEHYPFENNDKFEKKFPARFIAEGVDQTRAWFYYLHIIATAIKNEIAYENVIVNGIVLAEDGKKMAKRLQNYPEPDLVMDKYGADAMRYYLLSSPVMAAENLDFSEAGVKEAMQKVVMLLNNILNFYKLYENKDLPPLILPLRKGERGSVLDKWLLAKLNLLIKEVTTQMEAYDLVRSVRPIAEFIDEFSTWWLRRSRERFKEDGQDKNQALAVFRYVLLELAKVMAPFTPFIAEYLYREVGGEKESVHLDKWPEAIEKLIDNKILEQMAQVRKVVEMGLAARAENNIKIRQPLNKLVVHGYQLSAEFGSLIADEVNVKEVEFVKGAELKVELDTKITDELKVEGAVRELIRSINDRRKKQGLTISDKIKVLWQSDGEIIKKIFADEKYVAELKKNTITQGFVNQNNKGNETKVNDESVKLEIEKI